jgi:hypothetical protein
MTHKFRIGQGVYYEGKYGLVASGDNYKIVRLVPVENDNRLCYRIKSSTESYERVVEEHQLSRSE